MKQWWAKRILKGIFFIIVIAALLTFIVMSLWNTLIPDLFGGPSITFWQSLGLLLLSHILLRGWGPWRHAHSWKHDRWRKHMEKRLESMSPEEREKFKQHWKNRCGYSFDEKIHMEKEE